MGIQRARLNSRDWLDIQNAVSNSDLPNGRRIALLDKIGTHLDGAQAAEAAMSKEL